MGGEYTEDKIIEQMCIDIFQKELDWETVLD